MKGQRQGLLTTWPCTVAASSKEPPWEEAPAAVLGPGLCPQLTEFKGNF